MIQVSVIVCTFNHINYLSAALPSILLQSIKLGEYEVIVVNDGSTDGTSEYLNKLDKTIPHFYVINNTTNKGLAKSRNIGIAYANSNIIINLDDDNVADYYLVEEHLKAHQKHNHALIQGNQIFNAWILKNNFARCWQSWVVPGNNKIDKNNIPYKNICPGNISFKKNEVEIVGFFNETFKFWGLEDGEFAYRITNKAGLVIKYWENAKTKHIDESFNLSNYLRKYESIGRNAIAVIKETTPEFIEMTLYKYLEPISLADTNRLKIIKIASNIFFIVKIPYLLSKILENCDYITALKFPNIFYKIALANSYRNGVKKRKDIQKQKGWY